MSDNSSERLLLLPNDIKRLASRLNSGQQVTGSEFMDTVIPVLERWKSAYWTVNEPVTTPAVCSHLVTNIDNMMRDGMDRERILQWVARLLAAANENYCLFSIARRRIDILWAMHSEFVRIVGQIEIGAITAVEARDKLFEILNDPERYCNAGARWKTLCSEYDTTRKELDQFRIRCENQEAELELMKAQLEESKMEAFRAFERGVTVGVESMKGHVTDGEQGS